MKNRKLHIIVWKEEKLFVAKFLELELASQGKTKEAAIVNLKEALDLYLEDDAVDKAFPHIESVSTQEIAFN